jgi:hypothetical protein
MEKLDWKLENIFNEFSSLMLKVAYLPDSFGLTYTDEN